jgi:hypothetical protein
MSLRPEKCPTRCEGTLLTLRNTFIRLTTLFLWRNNRGSRRTTPPLWLSSLFVHCTDLFELSLYARRNKIIQFAARNKLFLLIHLHHVTTMTLHKAGIAPSLHSSHVQVRRKLTLPRRLYVAFCTKPRVRLSESAIRRQDRNELHDCLLTTGTLITLLQSCQAQLNRS